MALRAILALALFGCAHGPPLPCQPGDRYVQMESDPWWKIGGSKAGTSWVCVK